jgi:hypothetical protein
MSMPKNVKPHQTLQGNLSEVERLLQIHGRVAGLSPGRKYNVEVLNKSAIVLLVACWEAFIEDLAATAFTIILRRAKSHEEISPKVRSQAGRSLTESQNPLELWQLAGDGWRDYLKKYKKTLFERYIGKLNTPKPEQIDDLYSHLFGIGNFSSTWHWAGVKSDKAFQKLHELCELRGAISHRVAATQKVYKETVIDYIEFINHLAVETSNRIRQLIVDQTGSEPWPINKYTKMSNITV